MKGLILKCTVCGRYTLGEKCPDDGGQTTTVHPARFSPDDRYARYRSPLAYGPTQTT
ncbi:MAG: RNA-protein complex protein Nop10 [Thaumarchaeota archaeon]|nr:RNA-protein complex protein Nop10 [Nitrososphaerota archaeon]